MTLSPQEQKIIAALEELWPLQGWPATTATFAANQKRKAVMDFLLQTIREVRAQRDAELKIQVEKLRRTHMGDKDYPHDDCLRCTVPNEVVDEVLALLTPTTHE